MKRTQWMLKRMLYLLHLGRLTVINAVAVIIIIAHQIT